MKSKENPVYGYKCFDKGLTNRYGMHFEIGKTYHCEKNIKFGNDGHGFHICKRMEDTLRYFDAVDAEVDICEVKCFGDIEEYEDDYNGYYDMYACEYMVIEKLLTREEIINYALKLNDFQVTRFISLFKLNDKEIALFKQKFASYDTVQKYIDYYQYNDKEAFKRMKGR